MAAFDIEAAKKAGYSQKEIYDYIKTNNLTPSFDTTSFDVKGALDAGYTEKEIADFLNNKPQQPQPVAPQQKANMLRPVTVGASGFNRGVTNMVGLPVDILNSALSLVGMGNPKPVGGSTWLNEQRQKIAPDTMPQGVLENILNAVGEQSGSMIFPAAKFGQMMPLAKTALGAGTASGLTRSVTDNPYADMAAQVVGGTAPTLSKLAVSALPRQMERSMMERAAKFPTTLKPEVRARDIETMLDEGIKPYPKGLEKSNKIITNINSEVQSRINQFEAQGKTIPMGTDLLGKRGVLDPAIDYAKKTIPREAFPTKPTNQIADTITEFATGKPENIAIRDAQNYKQSINAELNDFYKVLASSPDKTLAQSRKWTMKTKEKIANGIREQIAEVFPEITGLNKREAALLELNKSLYKVVNRIAQHDLLSLRTAVAAAVNPKYALMTYVLDNPRIQSNLAVALRRARVSPKNITGLVGESAIQAGNISRMNQGGNK